MPVLDALPHISIIKGLKGILDFYYWKGIPCVRKWPVIPPSSRSPRSLESARIFGAIVAAYSLLGAILKELFADDARGQPRTARDLFVSAVLGHLHDHNMSDFLDLLTEATGYLNTLKDLADALQSRADDRLLVRGQDQLFSFLDTVVKRSGGTVSGADGSYDSPSPPAGTIWTITTAYAYDNTSPLTAMHFTLWKGADWAEFHRETKAFVIGDTTQWAGHVFLDENSFIRATFTGAGALDAVRLRISGFALTKET